MSLIVVIIIDLRLWKPIEFPISWGRIFDNDNSYIFFGKGFSNGAFFIFEINFNNY